MDAIADLTILPSYLKAVSELVNRVSWIDVVVWHLPYMIKDMGLNLVWGKSIREETS